MYQLDNRNVPEFLKRFYGFTDSLVRKIEIAYIDGRNRTISIWIATRDAKEGKNEGWVQVKFVVFGAKDYCFADTANKCAGLISHGVSILWFNGIVGLDFGYFVDPPADLAEMKSSKFFATGTSVSWSVEPY